MPKEKSVGAVLFKKTGEKPEFLLLHYPAGHWGIPKGHVEGNETEEETVRREILEETSLSNIELIPNFRHEITYFFRRGKETIFKEVTVFLARVGEEKVSISNEHTGFEWLSFDYAMQRLTFKNTKDAFEKASSFFKPAQ